MARCSGLASEIICSNQYSVAEFTARQRNNTRLYSSLCTSPLGMSCFLEELVPYSCPILRISQELVEFPSKQGGGLLNLEHCSLVRV